MGTAEGIWVEVHLARTARDLAQGMGIPLDTGDRARVMVAREAMGLGDRVNYLVILMEMRRFLLIQAVAAAAGTIPRWQAPVARKR